ncbi:mitochondrial import receptor subunit TOM6 homolog [Magnolia sinica]|uniref:mitochondrial import receptor subunit TOM6 homolog n=1 Tax=Magnolia sinica TaxID=86752 RepID=UPI00265AC7E1|nr:mitochondrial import receptor subunit TOM6 homolog [Magnolia sinica]XP_058081217.1 mitochondrial import receptor subunit TOM6 homolog [Magnolia sinica]
MFLGAIPRRPDKAVAYKQLKTHLMIMGAWVAVIRITPYVLHYLSQDIEELKLEL